MLKSVGDKSLLYVMATDAEYGSELKQHFAPLICGVGPVEAALNTALAIMTNLATGNVGDARPPESLGAGVVSALRLLP